MTMRSVLGALGALACATAAAAAGADGAASATARFVDVRGSHLYVETRGSGAPLVFLHGGILYFDNNFAKQGDYFAASRQVVGIDRRGHGHSPDDARPFSYQDMADDTAAVIEKLGLGPVDIVGHSDGGNIALLLARDHPALVRRIVISGANLRPALTAEQLEERSRWSPERFDEAAHKLGGQLPPYFRSDYEKTSPDGAARWWIFLAKSYRLWLTPEVIATADLKTIAAPVMVMAGDDDFTPLDETLEIYRNLPHAQLFIVPGTGHGTMMDRPELVNPAMRAFFEQAPATGRP
jgi:pimeloyl-ACP methyl ester carboxylesterase